MLCDQLCFKQFGECRLFWNYRHVFISGKLNVVGRIAFSRHFHIGVLHRNTVYQSIILGVRAAFNDQNKDVPITAVKHAYRFKNREDFRIVGLERNDLKRIHRRGHYNQRKLFAVCKRTFSELFKRIGQFDCSKLRAAGESEFLNYGKLAFSLKADGGQLIKTAERICADFLDISADDYMLDLVSEFSPRRCGIKAVAVHLAVMTVSYWLP